jgi:hypothetical protein
MEKAMSGLDPASLETMRKGLETMRANLKTELHSGVCSK